MYPFFLCLADVPTHSILSLNPRVPLELPKLQVGFLDNLLEAFFFFGDMLYRLRNRMRVTKRIPISCGDICVHKHRHRFSGMNYASRRMIPLEAQEEK